MSGHSHWATIKRKKEANDQKRGKEFSRVSREILLAVALGGNIVDPEKNVRLRAAIEKAKEVNMPKENIKNLLAKVKQKEEQVSEVIYEALFPHQVTAIIKTVTDNPRRTQTDIKIILDKSGGKLVEKGAVMYNYDLLTLFKVDNQNETEVLNLIEALAAVDFSKEGDSYNIYVPKSEFSEAWNKAKELGFDKAPELVYKPKALIQVDEAAAEKTFQITEKLLAIDEVQDIYLNIA
jgi:YebC/PmpR family DNA-binding regulatory protein